VAVVVLVAIGATAGIYYYSTEVAPFQGPIIKVNDTTITIDYFLRRVKYGGLEEDLLGAMQALVEEEVIRQRGPAIVGEVTEADIDAILRESARGENESISDVEYDNWYRAQLNESQLKEEEFRQMVGTFVTAGRLQEFLAERTPTVAEQIHLHWIVMDDYEDALKVSNKIIEEGADFGEMARTYSIDETAAENSGDIGWFPELGLPDQIQWVFNLEVGVASEPVTFGPETSTFGIYLVSEYSPAREMDEDMRAIVQASALIVWVNETLGNQEVTFHGRDGEAKNHYGSETEAWLRYQLSRM
jgi:hypothetical protein